MLQGTSGDEVAKAASGGRKMLLRVSMYYYPNNPWPSGDNTEYTFETDNNLGGHQLPAFLI